MLVVPLLLIGVANPRNFRVKYFLLSIDCRSRVVSSLRDCWSSQSTKHCIVVPLLLIERRTVVPLFVIGVVNARNAPSLLHLYHAGDSRRRCRRSSVLLLLLLSEYCCCWRQAIRFWRIDAVAAGVGDDMGRRFAA